MRCVTISDLKLCHRAEVIKTAWYSVKRDTLANGIELETQILPNTLQPPELLIKTNSAHWREDSVFDKWHWSDWIANVEE